MNPIDMSNVKLLKDIYVPGSQANACMTDVLPGQHAHHSHIF
jgi:hypothetical protein